MPTEQAALKIRQATPLDAVNLYKLLVDEERKTNTYVEHDTAARIAHILHVIATGYVSVVEKSGRIVGSLGFAAAGHDYALTKHLECEWSFLVPALQNAVEVSTKMTERLVRFADKHSAKIGMSAKVEASERVEQFLEPFGFVAVTTRLERPAKQADAVSHVQNRNKEPTSQLPVPPEGSEPAPAVRT